MKCRFRALPSTIFSLVHFSCFIPMKASPPLPLFFVLFLFFLITFPTNDNDDNARGSICVKGNPTVKTHPLLDILAGYHVNGVGYCEKGKGRRQKVEGGIWATTSRVWLSGCWGFELLSLSVRGVQNLGGACYWLEDVP